MRPPDAALPGVFLDFCRDHQPALTALIGKRVTNTNETGRSAVIASGLSYLYAQIPCPLYLIELGPSAGLNLNFDRYAYRFKDAAGRRIGDYWAPSALTIECQLADETAPQLGPAPPPVAGRIGLELNPVDLANADDRDWLRALVWPERTDRMARLAAALEIARDHPPTILEGDAIDLLAPALQRAPSKAAICVVHTAFAYQLPPQKRADIDAILAEAGRTLSLFRLFMEWDERDSYPLRLARYENGNSFVEELATSNPHGLSMAWRG